MIGVLNGCSTKRWGDKNHPIASNEQHGQVSLAGSVDLLKGLLIQLHCGHSLFHIRQNHVQVLVISL